MNLFKKRPEHETIEIDIKRPKLRIAIVIALAAVGLTIIGIGIASRLSTKKGWQQIEVLSTGNAHAGDDFAFVVYLDGGFMDQTAKKLTTAYSDYAAKAFQIFDAENAYLGVENLAELNRNPNTVIDIDPALYRALKLLQSSQNRAVFLGPVYEEYRGLFLCMDDPETVDFDPHENPEIRDYIEDILYFANDPEQIRLELYDGSRACLVVSDEYRAFAKEYNITVFLDLFWMRNAFVCDYMADALTSYGVEQAYLASKDGFIRCLDKTAGNRYRLSLTAWEKETAVSTGAIEYGGPAAFAVIRGYPVNNTEEDLYYLYQDGRIVTGYVSPDDGWDYVGTDERVFYAYDSSCAEVILKSFSEIVSGELSEDQALALAEDGVYTIFQNDGGYVLTDAKISMTEGNQ